MNTKQATCDERVEEQMKERLDDLRQMWELYQEDPEAYTEDDSRLDEFGLCFDYVAPETFSDQPRGYWRYQLSYGGPSEEFRIYAEKRSQHQYTISCIEFVFLDWFDGAKRCLTGDDLELMRDLILSFFGSEHLSLTQEAALDQA